MPEQAAGHPPELAILASFSGEGGVERMVLNLANAFAERGLRIDLLLIRTRSRHLGELHPAIRVIELGGGHTATSLPSLVRYLRGRRPPCLLAAKDRAGRLAVLARRLAGVPTRIVVRLGTNLSAALAGRAGIRLWLRRVPIRLLYPRIDCIIAVSEGVRQDTVAIAGIDPTRIEVVRNPVITPRLLELAQAATPHPWLDNVDIPVILGAGRLTVQKDFATLIRAFSRLAEDRPCRLLILGKGRQEAKLRTLAGELKVGDRVGFPGFTENPYAYMARAGLFVLSSRWEGSPNVLTEAMALGTPVVATDCPSGPREILANGRHGPLVPVGDWQTMARAMREVLDAPPGRDSLRGAVREYTAENSAARYLEILGVTEK
ncbi:MAG: glycosyltransferase [Gammaproteobacteria bacterium]|jgi:glycosyltransferase involved in cell wall biosynthesis